MKKTELDDFGENDLSSYSGEDKIISSKELYEKLKEKNKTIKYFNTKFPSINKMINGFTPGNLTVISGLSGNGKTLFCQTLTEDFARKGMRSLWFTYEVMPLQFLSQFGEDIPHFYLPSILRAKSTEWIYDRIREAKQKFDIQAIFIDHLHYLADIMISRNPSLEIGRVMRTLKLWSLDLELMTFLIAHPGKVNPERELGAGDIRDSSFVEQEADNVFYIWRSVNVENEAICKITKNRSHGVFDKKIKMIKRGSYLVELIDSSIENICNELDHDSADEIRYNELKFSTNNKGKYNERIF